MNFVDVQKTIRDLIAAHPTFAPNAANVYEDLGNSKHSIERALDFSTSGGPGWAVSVWPPARGHSDGEVPGASGVECICVVRVEYNPQFLTTAAAPLVPAGAKYSQFPGPNGPYYNVVGLVPGRQYFFTNANAALLYNGLVAVPPGSDFVASSNTVTLVGAAGVAITAQVQLDPASAGQIVNGMLKDLVSAVLSAPPELSGVKFALAPDAFELVTFYEGLVAYHFRFSRFAVFGT